MDAITIVSTLHKDPEKHTAFHIKVPANRGLSLFRCVRHCRKNVLFTHLLKSRRTNVRRELGSTLARERNHLPFNLGNHIVHIPVRRSDNWGSVALLSLPAAIAVALLYGCTAPFVWPVALAVICIPAVYEVGRRLKVRRLRKRVAANDPMTWTVFVNDVMVAKIEDAHYARAELDAWLAPNAYIAQASNVLRVAIATLGRVAVLTPLVLVWALAISALVSPQETAYALAHASTLTAKDVASFGQLWTTLSLLAFVFAGVVFPFFGMDIGYINHFERDIHGRVRRLVGTPADGVIRLTPDSIDRTELATTQSVG